MAERELKIISEARTSLNDTSVTNPRWSDERLVELLSDAQDDMCKNIPMISLKATMNLAIGKAEFNLPVDSVKLLTASSNGKPLTITSFDEIERDDAEWEDRRGGTFTHVIVNALSQQVIRPYPALAEGSTNQSIKVRYQAMPVRLGWEGDGADPEVFDTIQELTIHTMWDFGMKQYIIGMAFLDYGDEASISRSQVALGLYGGEYKKAERLAKSSFSKRGRTTGYQGKVANTRYMGGQRHGSGNCGFRR